MANKNLQIAKFYSLLFALKNQLNNELLPLAVHIGAKKQDAALFESLEIAAGDIERFLESYEISLSKIQEKV